MALAHLSIDGYPCWVEGAYRAALSAAISDRRAWVWEGQEMLGIATLAPQGDHLAYWAVHPRLRHRGGLQRLLALFRQTVLPQRAVELTTFRAGDAADTGHRTQLLQLGFEPRELQTAFGYPVQRMVLPANRTVAP